MYCLDKGRQTIIIMGLLRLHMSNELVARRRNLLDDVA